jgi:hypothetical protein
MSKIVCADTGWQQDGQSDMTLENLYCIKITAVILMVQVDNKVLEKFYLLRYNAV